MPTSTVLPGLAAILVWLLSRLPIPLERRQLKTEKAAHIKRQRLSSVIDRHHRYHRQLLNSDLVFASKASTVNPCKLAVQL